MSDAYEVLVLGGYGTFGRWIVDALAIEQGVRIWVGGRDKDTADLCANNMRRRHHRAAIKALEVDANSPGLAQLLRTHRIRLVIYTCGPFQGQSYKVARDCIRAGAHYLDLADGRDFVAGITELDQAAKSGGIVVISGASTVPGLSSAVVDNWLPRFSHLNSIHTSIVPGNQTERGLATVSGVLSYVGRPIAVWRDHCWCTAWGWQGVHRQSYGPLGMRWLADCDVPDLALFASRYPGVASVRFSAGLESRLLHFSLWLMSWLCRWRLVIDWRRHAALLTKISRWVQSWGSDAGGMRIELKGLDHLGRDLTLNWLLLARQGHGPRIPTISARILARKIIRGELTQAGARACLGMYTLEEFHTEVRDLEVQTSLSEQRPVAAQTSLLNA